MAATYVKPENALRKAQEFANQNRKDDALQTLQVILVSKKFRVWQPALEEVMLYFVTMAVDMKKPVKDALMQYKSICQQNNPDSMKKVVHRYRELAEQKAAVAQQDAQRLGDKGVAKQDRDGIVDVDGEDDPEESPESIMLQAVSGEDSKDRTDRQILVPWVKFLWETYRTILEVLRNNQKLEDLYHATARQAFEFCKKYERPTDFRKLCEMLRKHIFAIGKYFQQPNAVDLLDAETQRRYLETRFEQLRIASDLELWQEAYRTIEDIHENMRIASVTPKPSLMKTYYDKLAQIFWASENALFHAYSLSKYFELSVSPSADSEDEKKKEVITAEERSRLATAVVLASLVIPPAQRYGESESSFVVDNEGNLRLAKLLGFKKETPTRSRLFQVVAASILRESSSDAQEIYSLMESKLVPLNLKSLLQPILDRIRADPTLAKYVEPLKRLMLLRVLQQLSVVYQSMRLERFYQLAPDLSQIEIERVIMNAVKEDQLSVRLDHAKGMLYFVTDDIESAKNRRQLTILAQKLQKIHQQLSPEDKTLERQDVFTRVKDGVDAEHQAVFERLKLIENRKIEREKFLAEETRLKEEKERLLALNRQKEEKARLDTEAAIRTKNKAEAEKKQQEIAQAEEIKRNALKKWKSIGDTAALSRLNVIMPENPEMNPIFVRQHVEAVEEERKRETERRLRDALKRLDYETRALRIEERTALEESHARQLADEKEQNDIDFAKYKEQQEHQHKKSLAEKARLLKMQPEMQKFKARVLASRREQYETELKKYEDKQRKKAEERAKEEERKRAEAERQRREEARLAEENERKRKEEEEHKQKLAEEQRKKEEADKERRKKLDETAAKQRQREEEAEQKALARRQKLTTTEPERPTRAVAPEEDKPRQWRGRDDDAEKDKERERDGGESGSADSSSSSGAGAGAGARQPWRPRRGGRGGESSSSFSSRRPDDSSRRSEEEPADRPRSGQRPRDPERFGARDPERSRDSERPPRDPERFGARDPERFGARDPEKFSAPRERDPDRFNAPREDRFSAPRDPSRFGGSRDSRGPRDAPRPSERFSREGDRPRGSARDSEGGERPRGSARDQEGGDRPRGSARDSERFPIRREDRSSSRDRTEDTGARRPVRAESDKKPAAARPDSRPRSTQKAESKDSSEPTPDDGFEVVKARKSKR